MPPVPVTECRLLTPARAPRLSIIIVSWNVSELLAACLRSIAATCPPETEVIVVDSASRDDTVARVRREFPAVTLLAQAENVGFTRGSNIGLAAARGDTLLLLNPDTVLLEGAVPALLDSLNAHPQAGIAGPRTLNPDGTVQSTRRRFPSPLLAALESTWLQPLAPRRMLDRYYVRDADDEATVEVDWVQGSCLLARREVYEQIGGLDEGFVMYSEELDWCRRARAAGWKVVYVGSASIVHYGGQSSGQAGAQTHIRFNESKLRYVRKYHGRAAAQAVRAMLLLHFAAQTLIEAAKWLLGHKRPLRAGRVAVYWQVLRSGLRVS
jgi:GT2 family glycosyltransferase